jgi:hypothetical protein
MRFNDSVLNRCQTPVWKICEANPMLRCKLTCHGLDINVRFLFEKKITSIRVINNNHEIVILMFRTERCMRGQPNLTKFRRSADTLRTVVKFGGKWACRPRETNDKKDRILMILYILIDFLRSLFGDTDWVYWYTRSSWKWILTHKRWKLSCSLMLLLKDAVPLTMLSFIGFHKRGVKYLVCVSRTIRYIPARLLWAL